MADFDKRLKIITHESGATAILFKDGSGWSCNCGAIYPESHPTEYVFCLYCKRYITRWI